MTAISMRRKAVDDLLTQQTAVFSHAGLWLSRGLKLLDDDQPSLKQEHIKQAAKIPVPEIYGKALARWQDIIAKNPNTIAAWCGKLENRLFIGMGGASVLETAITLSRSYGVPVIPGSAVKGLVHAYAKKAGVADEHLDLLFGTGGDDGAESGAVIFHDAWWMPDSAKTPLVAEVVTVHHQEYYGGKQDEATDFDSPIPAPQIAAQGSFLFAVECGEKAWAEHACKLLAQALQDWGIGGKTAAGYGRFGEDKEYQERAKNAGLSQLRIDVRKALAFSSLSAKEQQTATEAAGTWIKTLQEKVDHAPDEARDIALELKEFYEKTGKWTSGKEKDKKKMEPIRGILGEP